VKEQQQQQKGNVIRSQWDIFLHRAKQAPAVFSLLFLLLLPNRNQREEEERGEKSVSLATQHVSQ
jgi:hypothetical protein